MKRIKNYYWPLILFWITTVVSIIGLIATVAVIWYFTTITVIQIKDHGLKSIVERIWEGPNK